MNYRTVDILAGTELSGSSGTETLPIRVKDIISRIMIYWQVTMVGEGMDSYQHKDISKIELVDGSDVLFSMDGGQAQALCIYDRKIPTMNFRQKYNGNSMSCMFGIDFGRFLHDPILALDPKKFDNLQLKITWNEAVADTGASANELEVKAEVFDEKVVSPIGFLSAKEIFKATTPGSGFTYIQLPTDHIIRKLLLQGYRKDYNPQNQIANARLDEDNDKRVVFDWDMDRYYRTMQTVWRPVEEVLVVIAKNTGQTFYVTPTDYYVAVQATSYDKDDFNVGVDSWQTGGKVTVYRSVSTKYAMLHVQGYMPNHCFEFALGDPKDIDDWYDVTGIGALRLRLNAGGGGGSGDHAVIVQQLRKY